MFEPLREILPEDPQALIDDARVLGERAGRLYGSRSADAYAALGGATYQPLQCVNEGVVGWGTATTAYNASGCSSSTSPSSSSLWKGDTRTSSWIATVLAWFGTAASSSRRRPHRRRGPGGVVYAVQDMLSAAPHVLPHLLHCAARAAASVFPSIRVMCATALPDASRLIEARQSCAGGPERVTALSFHPLYLWLAVAIDEGASDGSARLVLYNVAGEKVLCVLSHAFQKEVNWLQWKPYATDVLAVGCRGGVLLWSLSTAAVADAAAGPGNVRGASLSLESAARALFYRTRHGFTVTSAAFSNRDGSMLACASATDTRLHLLNLRQPPFSPLSCAAVVMPSVDGGLREVLFADDDLYMICAVCEHPSLALIRCSASSSTSSVVAVPQVSVVPTPAPVHCMARASGLGPSLFFLSTKGLEGVLLARIHPFIGVEVISMISTGLYRGIGGCVTHFTCSRRRLWIQTETNHLIVCRYGQYDGSVTLLPVGVAAMEAVALANFGGCTTGSLMAALEKSGTISVIPSYHS